MEQLMNKLIWIASYPRSGNTFIRALLAAYQFSDKFTINHLGQNSYGEHNDLLWQMVTMLPADVRSFQMEWRYRPQYFDLLRTYKAAGGIKMVKTHTANVDINGIPAFHFKPEDRIIFVVRHPGDVAISLSKYANLSIDQTIDSMIEPGACVPATKHTRAEFRSSWALNTKSWLGETSLPMLAVHYRNLVNNTESELIRMLEFLEIDISSDRIESTLAMTKFDVLADQESRWGFSENLNPVVPFFRLGKSDQWQDILSADQIQKLSSGNDELMDQLNFDFAPSYQIAE